LTLSLKPPNPHERRAIPRVGTHLRQCVRAREFARTVRVARRAWQVSCSISFAHRKPRTGFFVGIAFRDPMNPAAAVSPSRDDGDMSTPASAGASGPPAEETSTMMNLIRNFVREENGEDLIEYGLLAAFVAAVALVTIILDPIGIRQSLVGAFDKARAALDAQ
jgi:Flp pilus assembly pilin Flp